MIESEIKALFAEYYMPDTPIGGAHAEFVKRIPLVCTPFSGGDKEIDGWVICAMGSPPKGTVVILGGGSRKIAVYHIYGGSRRIDLQSQIDLFESFHKEWLRGKEKPFIIT